MNEPKTPGRIGDELPSLSTSLLFRVQRMQPEAWHRLVEVFSPIVYRWGRQAGLSGHDAADVVQDVFASVARGIARFEREKPQGSFRSWLATITRNRIRDSFRRLEKNPLPVGGTDFLSRVENVPDPLEQSISEVALNRAIPQRVLELVKSECETRTWQAFWKNTIKEESAVDVAAQLNMTVASVYQAKSRVLRRFRQRMTELP